MSAGRQVLRERAGDEEARVLLSPGVGVFTPFVVEGDLVSAGQCVGTIETLGARTKLTVPEGVEGRVIHRIGGERSRVPTQYGDVLLTLSTVSMSGVVGAGAAVRSDAESTLSFVAPMSGRFYVRPSPTEPPFVLVGDTVQRGQTVGLLEVMKTFNRLVYQGDALPEQATVERILPSDGDDVTRGQVLLALAPAIGE